MSTKHNALARHVCLVLIAYGRAPAQVSTGRAPGRAEKEALRPLYVRYWRLKRALQLASLQAQRACTAAANPAGGKTTPPAAAQLTVVMES